MCVVVVVFVCVCVVVVVGGAGGVGGCACVGAVVLLVCGWVCCCHVCFKFAFFSCFQFQLFQIMDMKSERPLKFLLLSFAHTGLCCSL